MDKRRKRPSIRRPNHILAKKSGSVLISRMVLYEALQGKNANCHWCKLPLFWRVGTIQQILLDSLCVDHLDGDTENNKIENLVSSCRACNANRGLNGRRQPRKCCWCKKDFLPHRREAVFCSNLCSARLKGSKIKGKTKAKHGTRSRYNFGCRCSKCIAENSEAWNKWRKRSRSI